PATAVSGSSGAPRITSVAAAPDTPTVSSSEPRCAPRATSTTAPTITASQVPRLRLRYTASARGTTAAPHSARTATGARGSELMPAASTTPTAASAPNAFQYVRG